MYQNFCHIIDLIKPISLSLEKKTETSDEQPNMKSKKEMKYTHIPFCQLEPLNERNGENKERLRDVRIYIKA